jgi:ABC-type glycerol-3-phosphate transport system substrate-binding protein
MTQEKKEGVSRRKYLGTVGALAVGAALGFGAGYLAKPTPPGTVTTLTQTLERTVTAAPVTSAAATAGPGVDYYYDPGLAGTTINWLAAEVPEPEWTRQLVPIFEEETGIKVNMVMAPETEVNAKAITEFAGKSGTYDILSSSFDGMLVQEYAMAGYTEDWEPYIAKTPPGWNKDDIMEPLRRACSYNDHLYGLMQGQVNFMLVYRKDLYDKEGIKTPETLDELMAATKHFDRPGEGLYGIGLCGSKKDLTIFTTWEMILWAYGGRFWDANYHPEMNSKFAQDATQYFVDLSKYAPAFTSSAIFDVATDLAQEKVAAGLMYATMWPTVTDPETSKVIGKAAYAPFPRKVCKPNLLACIALEMNKWSKNKWAAWSFLSWVNSPRILQKMFEIGNCSARTSIVTNPANYNISPYVIDQLSWLEGADVPGSGAPKVASSIGPLIPNGLSLVNTMVEYLAKATTGELTVKQMCDRAQEDTEKLLKEIGLYK